MSFEARIVRPFHRTSLDEALALTTFHFGDQVCDANAGIAVADPETFARSKGQIVWAPEDKFEDFKTALVQGVSELEVDLVGTRTRCRRLNHVHQTVRGSAPLPALRSGESGPCHGESPQGSDRWHFARGSTARPWKSYLLLLRELEKRPLRQWRKGTWISRAKFRIDVEKGAVLFRPIPLDDEKREHLNLPVGTVRYVDLEDHDVLEPFGESEPPRFYIDADFLRQTGRSPGIPRCAGAPGATRKGFCDGRRT